MNARNAAIVTLVLLPLLWLWPCVFGGRTFVPYDVAQFPPISTTASDAQLAAARQGANLDVTEVPVWFLPELELAHDELAAGRWPGWNPHARSGAPLHAHGLIGLLYPPNWLALSSDEPARRLVFVAWCNLVIGGLLAFGLFRQLGFAMLPAWLGAMLFELSGPMAANSYFWMRLGSFVWLPGILWAMLRIAGQQRLRPLAQLGLGAAFAMTWLAGFPPFAATTTVFAGVAFAWLVADDWRHHDRRAAVRTALHLSAGLGLGALWAMPQVLPSLLFFPESARPPTPLWRDIAGQAFEPYGLLGYLMPDAFGHATTPMQLPYQQAPMQLLLNGRVNLDGSPALPNYNFTEYTVFVSTFGLVLSVLGALLGRGHRTHLARIALVLALGLGLFWPGLQLLFHLPVVQNVWPMRWPAAATLFVAWLAASGCERLLTAPKRPTLGLAFACLVSGWLTYLVSDDWSVRYAANPDAIVDRLATQYGTDASGVVNHVQGVPPVPFDRFAAGFDNFAANGCYAGLWLLAIGLVLGGLAVLRSQQSRALLVIATGAATAVQLGVFGASFTSGAIRELPADSSVHAFLRERAAATRTTGGFSIVRSSAVPALPTQLPPGQLMAAGIRDLNFYSHADARTLQPVRKLLDDYAGRLGLPATAGEIAAGKGYLTQSLPAALLAHPYFDLIGVRYALASEALPMLGAATGPEVKGRGRFFVYERPRALPRAFTVPAVEACNDDAAVLARLTAETLQPDRQAFALRSALPVPMPPATTAEPRAVTFVRDEPQLVELTIAAGAAPWLVSTDTFLPGWTATIDGESARILRGNHSQRLLAIPENACRVVFMYTTPGFTWGLMLAGIATLLALLLGSATLRRRRAGHAVV